MSLNSSACAIGLALAASFGSTPVLAASADVSSAITELRFELIDLDLTDNITPSLQFGDAWNQVVSRASAPFEYDAIDGFGSTAVTRAYGASTASLAESELSTGAHFGGAIPDNLRFSALASRSGEFTLSPNTGLRISALGSLRVEQEGARDTYANLAMSVSLDKVVNGVHSETRASESHNTFGGARDYSISLYLSSGAQAAEGYFDFATSVQAERFTPTTPVPEPATYGMLLAGAAIVGAAVRRRRRG